MIKKTLNIIYCWQLAQLFRAWCKCRICDMSRYDVKYDFSYLNFIWIRNFEHKTVGWHFEDTACAYSGWRDDWELRALFLQWTLVWFPAPGHVAFNVLCLLLQRNPMSLSFEGSCIHVHIHLYRTHTFAFT